jgi:hypothetical protein
MKKRGIRRQVVGTVISDKMDKTVVVQVERLVKHRVYKKYVRRRSKFAALSRLNAWLSIVFTKNMYADGPSLRPMTGTTPLRSVIRC